MQRLHATTRAKGYEPLRGTGVGAPHPTAVRRWHLAACTLCVAEANRRCRVPSHVTASGGRLLSAPPVGRRYATLRSLRNSDCNHFHVELYQHRLPVCQFSIGFAGLLGTLWPTRRDVQHVREINLRVPSTCPIVIVNRPFPHADQVPHEILHQLFPAHAKLIDCECEPRERHGHGSFDPRNGAFEGWRCALNFECGGTDEFSDYFPPAERFVTVGVLVSVRFVREEDGADDDLPEFLFEVLPVVALGEDFEPSLCMLAGEFYFDADCIDFSL